MTGHRRQGNRAVSLTSVISSPSLAASELDLPRGEGGEEERRRGGEGGEEERGEEEMSGNRTLSLR